MTGRINPNYIAAKALLDLLSTDEKRKLCAEILEGLPTEKIDRKKRVDDYKKWLDKK
ncbi:hypothetical protein [Chryseobacterium lathyri]|uniref:hypothetical protein n=1 Tax=Chryseobacterium lathyri TaxID=395933 RepID=UPI001CBE5378|nr:hypothetical protein [Chryseobacterium lathyri]